MMKVYYLLFICMLGSYNCDGQYPYRFDTKINQSPIPDTPPPEPPRPKSDSCEIFFFGKNPYHLKLWAVESGLDSSGQLEITWGQTTFHDALRTEIDSATSQGIVNAYQGNRMWFIWDSPSNAYRTPFDNRIPMFMKSYHRLFKKVGLGQKYSCRTCRDETSQLKLPWLSDDDIQWMERLSQEKLTTKKRGRLYTVSRLGQKAVYDPLVEPNGELTEDEKERILRIKHEWFDVLMHEGDLIKHVLDRRLAFVVLRDIEAFTLYMMYKINGVTMFVRTDNEDYTNDRTDQIMTLFRTFEALCEMAGEPLEKSRSE